MADKYNIERLAKKYNDFFAPSFEVRMSHASLLTAGVAISRITVDTTLNKATTVEFNVVNAFDVVKREFINNWLDTYFSIGKKLEVRMGYADKVTPIFKGAIKEVTYDFPSDGIPKISVSGMDYSSFMMAGEETRTWNDCRISEVIQDVITLGRYTFDEVIVDQTTEMIPEIMQYNMSDYHFILSLAMEYGYDFWVTEDTLYFRKIEKNSLITLTWGKNLKSFSPTFNLNNQVSEVIVRGWNEKTMTYMNGTSGASSAAGDLSQFGESKVYKYMNVDSEVDAEDKAKAILNKYKKGYVTGTGECIGLPELVAGNYITLAGMGTKIDQAYLIESATHTIDSSGYTVQFKVGGLDE
jgi:uncharacterized protein